MANDLWASSSDGKVWNGHAMEWDMDMDPTTKDAHLRFKL
jgi:hypothetical protein